VRTKDGLNVQTNGQQLVNERTPRIEAKWEAAIRELEDSSLMEDRGHKREVFAVTDKGFEVADRLRLQRPETDRQRKMRKIAEMIGTMITLRWLNAPEHFAMLGRVRAEAEMIVRGCDEDTVFLENAGSNARQSLPIDQVYIGYDDVRHRAALEYKP